MRAIKIGGTIRIYDDSVETYEQLPANTYTVSFSEREGCFLTLHCLMLLLKHPMRLSTDIDIIVKPGTDIYEYIKRAAEIFPFKAQEEQVRIGKNNIEKRHFKFTYDYKGNNNKTCVVSLNSMGYY